ncbi:MAG: shikimate dehydrogenase [Lachnospiraceae bacterium]|nr:shikimate dehydrogenase [Lachnospiraceae bacterium]MBQ7506971.1 shikimate dehydrogenase [Lachnospiraceae bacterium]
MSDRLSGKTGLLALIGSPVSHSMSPAMYNYSFERLGIDACYLAFDVKEEGVKGAFDAMRLFSMRGMNVTMPDKIEAAKTVDRLSPAARLCGAVNTVVNDGGVLTGYNTDGEGFVKNLTTRGIEVAGKKVVLIGAGGAAASIQAQLALDHVGELALFNKKDGFFSRLTDMKEKLGQETPEVKIGVFDLDETETLRKEIAEADILINATIAGMKPHEDTTVIPDPSFFREGLVVCDTVYNPVETRLLREAKEHGAVTVDGKGMLLYQGVVAFKLYTGQDMPVEEVKERFFS